MAAKPVVAGAKPAGAVTQEPLGTSGPAMGLTTRPLNSPCTADCAAFCATCVKPSVIAPVEWSQMRLVNANVGVSRSTFVATN